MKSPVRRATLLLSLCFGSVACSDDGGSDAALVDAGSGRDDAGAADGQGGTGDGSDQAGCPLSADGSMSGTLRDGTYDVRVEVAGCGLTDDAYVATWTVAAGYAQECGGMLGIGVGCTLTVAQTCVVAPPEAAVRHEYHFDGAATYDRKTGSYGGPVSASTVECQKSGTISLRPR